MNKHTRRPTNKVPLFMLAVVVGLITILVVRINAINTTSTAEPTPQSTPIIERPKTTMAAPPTTSPPSSEPTPEPTPARVYYDVPLAEEHQDVIYDSLELFDIDLDTAWVLGIVYRESNFDRKAVSSHGAQGYLQLMPATYKDMYKKVTAKYPELELVDDVFNPKTNLTCGLYYLRYVADVYGNGQVNESTIHELLTRYNRGPSGGKSYYKSHGTWESSYSLLCEVAGDHIRNNGNAVGIPDTY